MRDRLRAAVRAFRNRNNLGADMDDEMRFHIDQCRQDLIRQGMPPEEARWQARRAFGNLSQTQEQGRKAKGLPVFDELIRNVAYAVRQLRRAPGFAAAVIMTLALCIGVNTAVFSVIDAVMLRRLPYPQPERLFDVVRQFPNQAVTSQDGFAWEGLKDGNSYTVAALGGILGVNLATGNRAYYVHQQRVSAHYFSVLGIPMAQGREFELSEDRDGGPDAVVLSYPIWKRFFNADPSIVGRTILLRGAPFLVVGVSSASFIPQEEVDLWTPLRPSTKGEGGGTNYQIIARLKPGVTVAEAEAEIQARGEAVFEARKNAEPLHERMTIAQFDKTEQAGLRERLLILWAAVGVVLIIGCVNIAALMLARGATRRREMGTRIALGGGMGPLIRQLTTESIVLGLMGGAAGLALGFAVIQALHRWIAEYGVWQDLRLDSTVLLATLALTLVVSIACGLAPAIQAARVDVRATLLEGGSRGVAGGGSHWMRRILVLAEVALSLVLLVGAGLLIRTLLHLENLTPGFDGTNVLAASASLQDARYADAKNINRLFRDTTQAMETIPGVQGAAAALHLPYQRWLNSGVVVRSGNDSQDREVATSMNYVTPEYFTVLRIPLRDGRVFTDQDASASAPVVIVNETFARKFLNGNLNGYLVDKNTSRQIIGIVADVQQQPGLQRAGPLIPEPVVYFPATQFPSGWFQMAHTWYSPSWVVRSAGAPNEELSRGVEQAIASADPMLPVAEFRSLIDERNTALSSQRSNAWLLGFMAALALVLAMVGVYGIVANSVVERTREFGIRMALGSSIGGVIRDAVAPGVILAAMGAVLGGGLAAASVTVLKGLLYGVRPMDPLTFVLMSVALIAVSAIASLLPALTLIRLEASSVLRQD